MVNLEELISFIIKSITILFDFFYRFKNPFWSFSYLIFNFRTIYTMICYAIQLKNKFFLYLDDILTTF